MLSYHITCIVCRISNIIADTIFLIMFPAPSNNAETPAAMMHAPHKNTAKCSDK